MIRMIRRDGGVCYVHESRVEEYKAAGCRLPPSPPPEPKKKRVSRPGTRTKTEKTERK